MENMLKIDVFTLLTKKALKGGTFGFCHGFRFFFFGLPTAFWPGS